MSINIPFSVFHVPCPMNRDPCPMSHVREYELQHQLLRRGLPLESKNYEETFIDFCEDSDKHLYRRIFEHLPI